ncbi:hypothetical protein BDI4_730036 [Burkholderia diffusa]|nr:hypothetical protein BDI4_730036 [Burkholderia diffusa]
MCASALHCSTCSFARPVRSLPNTSAMSPVPTCARACSAAARGARRGGPYSRARAVSAIDHWTPDSASPSVGTTCADARTSSAPLAIAIASGSLCTCGTRGATSTSLEKPIVFSARAAAPTLPGWLGSTSTKRVDVKPPDGGGDEAAPDSDGAAGFCGVSTTYDSVHQNGSMVSPSPRQTHSSGRPVGFPRIPAT